MGRKRIERWSFSVVRMERKRKRFVSFLAFFNSKPLESGAGRILDRGRMKRPFRKKNEFLAVYKSITRQGAASCGEA